MPIHQAVEVQTNGTVLPDLIERLTYSMTAIERCPLKVHEMLQTGSCSKERHVELHEFNTFGQMRLTWNLTDRRYLSRPLTWSDSYQPILPFAGRQHFASPASRLTKKNG